MTKDQVRYVYISRRHETARSALGLGGLPRWLVSARTVSGVLIESEHDDEKEMRRTVSKLLRQAAG